MYICRNSDEPKRNRCLHFNNKTNISLNLKKLFNNTELNNNIIKNIKKEQIHPVPIINSQNITEYNLFNIIRKK